MSYIYLLDGIEFDAPVNDKELITTIKRNANLDGFLITQDADLTFAGNAYTYIYQMFNDDTFCSEIEIEILEECEGGIEEIYKGILKLSSAVFEEDDCTVRVKVQDNSFYSYINNNKSIDISPTQTGTKSGIDISPCTPYDITTFDPETGSLNPDVIEAYRVYDLMEHAVTVMTDGKVGFRSDFLWNQDEELFLTTGNALAEAGNPATFVYSFDKLYSELNKLFNLSFFIEEDLYQTPTLRIEPKDYFYQTSEGISFENIKSLKVSVDQSKIYGTVILGSSVLSDIQGVFSFNEDTPFYGFKQEKFYPIGQCNLDTELNLVNDYVISSNVIQDCVMESAKQYYDQNIFLSCGDVDIANKTADAILYELGGTAPPYIYNLNLNNYNKAQNHFSYINSNLLDSFNVSSENFHAEKATDTVYACGGYPGTNYTNIIFQQGGSTPNFNYYEYEYYQAQYPFPDESSAGNYDLGGNYDNTTYRYIVPSDGRRTFSVKMFYDVVSALNYNEGDPSAQRWEFYVIIQRYDSLLNYIEENVTTNNISRNQGGTVAQLAEGSASFDCNTGDIIQVSIGFFIRLWQSLVPLDPTARCAVKVKSTSFFESNSDNLIVGASNINYKILRYEFQLPLSKADFNTLKADPTGLQTFTKWSEAQQEFRVRRAWIEEIKYNNWEQFASVKLIANNAIIQE